MDKDKVKEYLEELKRWEQGIKDWGNKEGLGEKYNVNWKVGFRTASFTKNKDYIPYFVITDEEKLNDNYKSNEKVILCSGITVYYIKDDIDIDGVHKEKGFYIVFNKSYTKELDGEYYSEIEVDFKDNFIKFMEDDNKKLFYYKKFDKIDIDEFIGYLDNMMRYYSKYWNKIDIEDVYNKNIYDKFKSYIYHKNLNYSLNTIFTGVPGTGKTYTTIRRAVEIVNNEYIGDYSENLKKFKELQEKGNIEFLTFHQSYSYEDFIEGIRPVLKEGGKLEYELHNGVFKELVNRAKKDKNGKYVLIIDEINRGNISKIFGELITLIEESKREGNRESLSVKLPYSNENFSVPKNLYILGTMNSTDKSISLFDIALRRRFVFEEIAPNYDLVGNYRTILENINNKIKELLGKDFQVGHSYFMGINNDDEFDFVIKNKIKPLLEEYFLGEEDKVKEDKIKEVFSEAKIEKIAEKYVYNTEG